MNKILDFGQIIPVFYENFMSLSNLTQMTKVFLFQTILKKELTEIFLDHEVCRYYPYVV